MRSCFGLAVAALAASMTVAVAVPAAAEGGSEEQTLDALINLTPGVSEAEMKSAVSRYAASTGVSVAEVLQDSYADAKDSQERAATVTPMSAKGPGTVALGVARRVGDVFVSPAATGFVEHGHTGIYSKTNSIVEAPGVNRRSHQRSVSGYRVGKGAVKQHVMTSAKNRTTAVRRSLQLLGRGYNGNFAFNKSTNGRDMNCSQLVWAAYKAAGVDLDSNGGPGVYPYNIKDSKHVRTYQTL